MAGTLVTLTEAVKESLNGETFTPEFEAVRAYAPVFNFKELAKLRVSVVPAKRTIEALTRGQHQFVDTIHVAIQQKIAGGAATATIDALTDLVEEVVDFLRRAKPLAGSSLESIINAPIYDPEHLREHSVFTGLISVTYLTVRSL